VHGGGVTGRGPKRGFAAADAMIVVEHPPVHDGVAQLDDTCGEGVSPEVVLFAVDVLQLSGFLAVVLLANEHLDLGGEAQEAGVEVAGDPVPAGVGYAGRRLGGVVALVLAEQHDLGAVILAAQQPWLVLLVEGAPAAPGSGGRSRSSRGETLVAGPEQAIGGSRRNATVTAGRRPPTNPPPIQADRVSFPDDSPGV
jgi:hypothetical protein